MKRVEKVPIEQMDIGQLETAYFEIAKARAGGIIMIIMTLPLIAICHAFNFMVGYWFFGFCLIVWIAFTVSFHSEMKAIHARIKDELGVE